MSVSASVSMSSQTDADTDVLRANTPLLTVDDNGCDSDDELYTTSQTTDTGQSTAHTAASTSATTSCQCQQQSVELHANVDCFKGNLQCSFLP